MGKITPLTRIIDSESGLPRYVQLEPQPKHKTKIKGYTLNTLAKKIGDLRYDALSEFLNALADKIQEDGKRDKKAKKTKLAKELDSAQEYIRMANDHINGALNISLPRMMKKVNNE